MNNNLIKDRKTLEARIGNFNNTNFANTKFLIPKINSRVVNRLRLFEKMKEVIDNKFTIVCAPAGFGKTTLVSSWISFAKLERQAIWVSLDEKDNENQFIFWEALVTSVYMAFPEHFAHCVYMFKSDKPYPIESIINILINKLMSLERDIIVVLDDFHTINNSEIYKSFRYFLKMVSDNVHIILVSRHKIAKLFSIMKSVDKIINLHSNDIKFTFEETKSVIKYSVKNNITEDKIQELYMLTGGWITAIKLLINSYNENQEKVPHHSNLAARNEYLINYLTEETINIQPQYVQDFLIKSSIFDTFNSSLCDYVFNINNSKEILELLEQENIFIYAVEDDELNYKYFDLFRMFMQSRLSSMSEKSVNSLYIKASEWYERKGLYNLAIEYSFRSNNIHNSIRLLEGYLENYAYKAEFIRFINYVERIPRQHLKSAKLIFAYVVALSSIGKLDQDESYLHARGIYLENEDYESFKGQIIAIKTHNALITGHVSNVLENSKYAIGLLEQSSGFSAMAHYSAAYVYLIQLNIKEAILEIDQSIETASKLNHMFALVMSVNFKAIVLMMNMRLGEASSLYENTLALIGEEGEIAIQVSNYLHLGLANIYYESDNLESALNYAERSIELSKLRLDNNCLIQGYLILSKIHIACNNHTEALSYIESIDKICSNQQAKFSVLQKLYDLIKALIRIDRLDLAEYFYSKYTLDIDCELRHFSQFALIEILTENKKYEEALLIINELENYISRQTDTFFYFYINIQKSLIYKKNNDKERAIEYLTKALSTVKGEMWIRTLLDCGTPMLDMINELVEHMKYFNTNEFSTCETLIRIKLSFDNYISSKEKAKICEQTIISKREMEVLRLVSQGLTNAEIAEILYLSLITIKKHLGNIFVKLNVSNRVQAVEEYKKIINKF